MRITFKRPSTGVAYMPGLAKEVVIDTAALPQDEAAELERLVQAADFFSQPTVQKETDLAQGAADYNQYKISVDMDGKHHTLELTRPLPKGPAMQALVSFLESKANALARASKRAR
jgi:hypothetical protein